MSDRAAAQPAPRNLVQGRDCGACKVCCRIPDVPELNKPRDTWCEHIRLDSAGGGCGIYDIRPSICRDYKCGWLNGLGDTGDRPDLLGVMWQPLELPDGRPGLGFVEVWPGAMMQPRVHDYLERFHAMKPGQVVIRKAGEPMFTRVTLSVGGKPVRGGNGPSAWQAYEPKRPEGGAIPPVPAPQTTSAAALASLTVRVPAVTVMKLAGAAVQRSA